MESLAVTLLVAAASLLSIQLLVVGGISLLGTIWNRGR
jgi:hypothetical protein